MTNAEKTRLIDDSTVEIKRIIKELGLTGRTLEELAFPYKHECDLSGEPLRRFLLMKKKEGLERQVSKYKYEIVLNKRKERRKKAVTFRRNNRKRGK